MNEWCAATWRLGRHISRRSIRVRLVANARATILYLVSSSPGNDRAESTHLTALHRIVSHRIIRHGQGLGARKKNGCLARLAARGRCTMCRGLVVAPSDLRLSMSRWVTSTAASCTSSMSLSNPTNPSSANLAQGPRTFAKEPHGQARLRWQAGLEISCFLSTMQRACVLCTLPAGCCCSCRSRVR